MVTPAARVRETVRRRQNWVELARFTVVGGSGYAVNICAFAACVHVLGIDYRISAVIAFVVAVCNNFWLNRHWTFGVRHGHLGVQAARFVAVYALTFGFTYLALIALVDGAGLSKVLAQGIANAYGAPVSFVGQKVWSFRA
jgi:putative flippase GtrA